MNQSVLDAYRHYQQVYEQVYEANDPGPLNAVAVDPLLSIITRDVESVRAKGEIWRFHNVLNPEIQGRSKDQSIIVVLDCVQTIGAYLFDARTGKRLGAYHGGTFLYQSIMKYTDGTWKISAARQGKPC